MQTETLNAKAQEKETQRALLWREDYVVWTRDYFGRNIANKALSEGMNITTKTGLGIQQEQAFKEVDKLIMARLKKLAQTQRPELNIKLTEQDELYLKKIGVSIMAGRGVGKDFWLAVLAARLLSIFPDCRIVVTANTDTQLKNVFWSRFKTVANLALKYSDEDNETIFTKMFEIQSEKCFCKDTEAHPEWFMEAIVSRKQPAGSDAGNAAISGRHGKYLFFFIDEGSHVEDYVFKDFEETMTGAVNLMFIVFNPKRTRGYAIDTQYKDKDRWVALRWNAEESEIITNKDKHKEIEDKYGGKNSNPYRISVLGLPPLADTDTLIPADWIEDAKTREIAYTDDDPLIKSFDVGGGGDPSVIGSRRGYNFKDFGFDVNKENDSNKVTQWARTNFLKDEADAMVGDVGNLGWAVIGSLRKDLGWRIVPYDSRNTAIRSDLYYNKRAEDYFKLRDIFQDKLISIPDDDELTNELLALQSCEKNGKRAIIDKKLIRKALGGESTNKSDVLAMSVSVDDDDFRKNTRQDEDDEDAYCVATIRNPITGY